jgi:hypothetical protein
VNVVQPELVGILCDFDLRAPGVFDEREPEDSRHVAERLEDLRTVGL